MDLKLSQTVFDRPVGLAQLIVPGEPALAKRLVHGAEFFDFLSQFPKLAVQVLLALEEISEEAFDWSAGRGLHGLFESEGAWSVEPAKRQAARRGASAKKGPGVRERRGQSVTGEPEWIRGRSLGRGCSRC